MGADKPGSTDRRDLFEADEEGQIIYHPLTGWALASVDSFAVLCRLEYAAGREDFASGSRQQLQLVLSVEQAAKLAEVLLRKVEQVSMRQTALPVA